MEPNIVFGLCLGCFVVGLALGWLLFRGGGSSATQKAEQAKTELADYREAVNEHFSETAEHFKALGRNYRDLYEHMARGSEALMGQSDGKLPFVSMEQLLAASDDTAPEQSDEQNVVAEQAPDPSIAQEADAEAPLESADGAAAPSAQDVDGTDAAAPAAEDAQAAADETMAASAEHSAQVGGDTNGETDTSNAFAEERIDDPKPADVKAPERRSA